MNRHYASASSLLLALVLGGCAETEQADSEAPQANPFGEATVATINGAPIYATFFDAYATARLQQPAEDLSDDDRDLLLEELIQFHLLAGSGHR